MGIEESNNRRNSCEEIIFNCIDTIKLLYNNYKIVIIKLFATHNYYNLIIIY